MKITIEYEASWRNSFLDGSNDEPLPQKGRNFIGSMTALKTEGNFIQHSVSKNTVMGVLNRLIGDQQKLYQARQQPNYYFADIEDILQEGDIVDKPLITNEMAYIRNVSGSTDQDSFTGLIKGNDPIFMSDYSNEFWGILSLDINKLCDFVLNPCEVLHKETLLNPICIANLVDQISELKLMENEGVITEVVSFFTAKNCDLISDKVPAPYIENNQKVKPIRLYAAALYLQLERLSGKYDTSSAKSVRGGISGFSKRGYNGRRDFMNRYSTGKPKLIWGNPYISSKFIKGEGKVTSILTKASGELEIYLNISSARAKDLEQKIENAGVSAFYLGKKGIAYVKEIR